MKKYLHISINTTNIKKEWWLRHIDIGGMRTFRKNIVRVEAVILTIAVIASSLALAQSFSEQKKADDFTFEWTVTFSFEELEFSQIMDYDLVSIHEGEYLNNIGMPMLPMKNIQLALPHDMKAESICIRDKEKLIISGEYDIFPAQPPRKTNGDDEEVDFVQAKSFNGEYPSKLVDLSYQTDLAGQSIVSIQIYPIHYIKDQKKLVFYTSIDFIIEGTNGYEYKDYLPETYTEKTYKIYQKNVEDIVVNDDEIQLRQKPDNIVQPLSLPPGGPFDYVLITSTIYDQYWEPLIEWRTKSGMRATIVTTSYIYSNYGGSSNQQKIRNFIIDARNNWGTMYFLLAGEHSTVPFEYRTYYQESTPSDQYYSDYDDDWTNEVYVGRVTAQGTTQINTFINKLIAYETNPELTNYLLDVLLIGMDPDYQTHMEDLKEYIDNYIPGQFIVTKVYDSHGGNHETAVKTALNDGQHLVNHADHGDWDYMGTGDYWHGLGLYNYEIDALTNNGKPSIVVSLACHPNEMDASDCIAEHFVIYNSNQAGVAFTGNTRYGWYYVGQTLGLSNTLDYEWWRSLFNRHYTELGHILVDAKHHFSTGYPDTNVKQHCEWEFSLLGDPAMPVWTNTPDDLIVNHPNELPIGTSPFSVHVESDGGIDIYDAYVCLWKDGEVYTTGHTDSGGDVTLYPAPATVGTLYVTVTNNDYFSNYLPYQGQATVIEGTDEDPPTPNPLTWDIPPIASSPTEIIMQCTEASDDTPPIYYYFDFVTGGSGGTDSGWQPSTTYLDSGLQPNTQYSYRVRAQDNVDPPNIGSYSSIVYIYTHANIPDTPSVSNPTTTTLDIEVNPNDNPTITEFAILCDSSNPYDATWEGKFVNANGDPSSSEVWQTESVWGIATVKNLNPDTTYCFAVKARNEDNIETEFSTAGCEQTLPEGQDYILTIIIEGNGNVDLDPDLPTYPEGTEVTLEGIGDAGWRLYHWSGDLDTYDNPTTIFMDDDKTVIAQFWRIGDTNGDEIVNVIDLLYLLASWGTDDPAADFNRDGIVNVVDLLDLLANWG